MGDSITSYQNRSDIYMFMFEHKNRKGFIYCIPPGKGGNVIPEFNDKASSLAGEEPHLVDEKYCNFVDRD